MKNLESENHILVSKGTILLKQGSIATQGYLVKKGCLKSYTLDNTGKEHILQFAPESWLITDLDSFTNQIPAIVCIEAVEDSEISEMNKSDFKEFSDLDKDSIVEMATKLRNNLIATNKRVIGLLSSTAEQRYLDFTNTYPTLIQRLPLKLIASYIGITPEYLSEIRRKLAKK
ncbi:Crp/Fnr family transcriptional regulator [Leeuwenhoekiella sp. MAR_2009_132]|uniref:Crp/Fnr family transcriptional regulator n=1 Tax=Leeuwenhoekiella sp. MAR_2009_132 TaxID=1392489 RepID=UPI00068FD253|nr:Crp/Fnr family transcriptional regulator [Leeuwenhoekiella sp. MAR_2009_132]